MDKKIPSDGPVLPADAKALMDSGTRQRYALGAAPLKKGGKP